MFERFKVKIKRFNLFSLELALQKIYIYLMIKECMSSQEMEPILELPLLTFNSLYNILREEKRMKSLQKLPEGFYEAFEKFIDNKKQEIKKLKNDEENKEKLMKDKNIYLNSLKIYDELLNIRCLKIANVAIKNGVFDEEVLSKDNILARENDFFSEVQKAMKKIKIKL